MELIMKPTILVVHFLKTNAYKFRKRILKKFCYIKKKSDHFIAVVL